MIDTDFYCPHCDAPHSEALEYFYHGDSNETEIDCENCGKPFMVYRQETVTYDSYAKKEDAAK